MIEYEISSFSTDICFDVGMISPRPFYHDYGSGQSWNLVGCAGNNTYSTRAMSPEKCCIQHGHYNLSCQHAGGNGWNTRYGHYPYKMYVLIQGQEYCKNFIDGKSQTQTVHIESKYRVLMQKTFYSKLLKYFGSFYHKMYLI